MCRTCRSRIRAARLASSSVSSSVGLRPVRHVTLPRDGRSCDNEVIGEKVTTVIAFGHSEFKSDSFMPPGHILAKMSDDEHVSSSGSESEVEGSHLPSISSLAPIHGLASCLFEQCSCCA